MLAQWLDSHRFPFKMCCVAEVIAPSKELFELLKADVHDS